MDTAWARHGSTPVLMVYEDAKVPHRWLSGFDALTTAAGFKWYGQDQQQPCLGKHSGDGKCYLLNSCEAKALLRLLVCNSYVHFGTQVFEQSCGIPMGINPAVYMANYYLFCHECMYLDRLAGLVEAHPPNQDGWTFAESFFAAGNGQEPSHWVASTVPDHRLWDVAGYVVHSFRHTARCVDGFTSGPNRLLKFLWYHAQSILGDAVTGIYPGPPVLELAMVPGDPWAYPTLDVGIVSSLDPTTGAVHSTTHLYGKRREPCYEDIPIVRFIHVASAVSALVGPNVLLGQLHRFSRVILDRGNLMMEVAECMKCMMARGVHKRILIDTGVAPIFEWPLLYVWGFQYDPFVGGYSGQIAADHSVVVP